MREPLRRIAHDLLSPSGDQRWIFAGTFLIAFSLLSFEVSTVRTISFAVGPSFIYFAIALAMLGLSAAGSILSLVDLKRLTPHRTQILFWSSLGIVALLLATHFVTAEAKADLNAVLAEAGRRGGTELLVRTLVLRSLVSALQIGVLLSLPYFLFGRAAGLPVRDHAGRRLRPALRRRSDRCRPWLHRRGPGHGDDRLRHVGHLPGDHGGSGGGCLCRHKQPKGCLGRSGGRRGVGRPAPLGQLF